MLRSRARYHSDHWTTWLLLLWVGCVGGRDGFVEFIEELGLLGFDLRSKDLSNSVFSVFQFERTKREPDVLRFTWSFDPWVYKKR